MNYITLEIAAKSFMNISGSLIKVEYHSMITSVGNLENNIKIGNLETCKNRTV